MSTPADDALSRPDPRSGALFPITSWSTVLKTRGDASVDAAMNDLCGRYWHPIYAYLRGRGFERADAQDIAQSFFLMAVTDGLFQSAEEERGRLRSFLLGALTRHLAQHLRRERAVKRGGRAIVVPLECEDSEERFAAALVEHRDPETIYLKSWAGELVRRAMDRTRAHYAATNRAAIFDILSPAIAADDESVSGRELAAQLGVTETAARLQLFRVRQRFGKLLRAEVSQTVRTPDELGEELDWLLRIVQEDRP